MLSKLFVYITCLICAIGYTQSVIRTQDTVTYVTYHTDEVLFHEIRLLSEELCLFVPPRPLFNSINSCYKVRIANDTIAVELPKKNAGESAEDIIQVDKDADGLIQRFMNGKFRMISKNEIRLSPTNRPYFDISYLDSLIGKNQRVCAVQGEIKRIPADFDDFSEIENLYDKPKKIKIKKLDGKEGYEKYGAIGIRGVIEFYEKKKCNKK